MNYRLKARPRKHRPGSRSIEGFLDKNLRMSGATVVSFLGRIRPGTFVPQSEEFMAEMRQRPSLLEPDKPANRRRSFPKLVLAERKPGRSPIKDIAAFLLSALGHAAVLVMLAFCVLPVLVGRKIIVSAAFSTDDGAELETIQVLDDLPGLPSAEIETVPVTHVVMKLDIPEFDISLAPANAIDGTGFGDPAAVVSGVAAEAATVEGAVDGITGSIQGKLQDGDLLVVWLFDASLSLVDDRQRVAARLEPFLKRTAENRRESSGHQLLNAVVSFGSNMKQRVWPTESGEQIVAAVEKLPIDPSGKENVFTAIARCAEI